MGRGGGLRRGVRHLNFWGGGGVENGCILVLYAKNKSGQVLLFQQNLIKSSYISLELNKRCVCWGVTFQEARGCGRHN